MGNNANSIRQRFSLGETEERRYVLNMRTSDTHHVVIRTKEAIIRWAVIIILNENRSRLRRAWCVKVCGQNSIEVSLCRSIEIFQASSHYHPFPRIIAKRGYSTQQEVLKE